MPAAGEPKSPWIVATSDATFDDDVLVRSRERPVVVDFWAAWCQPCRVLGPVLEELARRMDGAFLLVTAETDRLPEATTRFQVQGIPAVYAVSHGEVIDGFVGILAPEAVASWVGGVARKHELGTARGLEGAEPERAEAAYRRLVESGPDDPDARTGLARLFLAAGRHDACREQLDELDRRGVSSEEVRSLRSRLELSGLSGTDLEQARRAAAADPDDLEARLALARALAGRGTYAEALELGLSIVEADPKGLGEEARKLMVEVFRVMPPDSDLVRESRQRLAMLLT